MTEQKLTELLRHAYHWGRDNGSNQSEKNFNDFLQTEAVKQALSIANVSNSLVDKKFMDWLAKEAPEVNESLWNCIYDYKTNDC